MRPLRKLINRKTVMLYRLARHRRQAQHDKKELFCHSERSEESVLFSFCDLCKAPVDKCY